MGGSAADTPATPEDLRASDAERDRAVSALRQEFVEGRLSHETFILRMQSALGARNRGQLDGLFTDLPPRPAGLLARVRAAFRPRDQDRDGAEGNWYPGSHAPRGGWGPRAGPGDRGWLPQPAPMVFPPGSGTRFTIGRTQDCDLRIADLSVSRLHAQLERGEDGWLLSDLGSHNGTRVNGWRVREPVPIRPGDVLQFGSAAFVIQARDGGRPVCGRPEGTEGCTVVP
jgi:hypothetical protein